MKKMIALCLAVLLAAGSFSACRKPTETENADAKNPRIVTTIFPLYDWTMRILGENPAGANVTLLLDNGVDLHSFQPTADDIVTISNCDLFLYVGGESDEWVSDALSEPVNTNQVAINMLDALGDDVKEEETVAGMQAEEDDDEEDETEIDEHIWLSLRRAETLCGVIADAICTLDPDNASVYRANEKAYANELAALDDAYRQAVAEAKRDTILFGDRFPFRYLSDDYGLSYYAAFSGCSAETEASFETITFLSKKVDELSLPCVLTIEGDNHKIAETIVQNTVSKDQKIRMMNSMQSTTKADIANGASYLSIMTENLSVLSEALR